MSNAKWTKALVFMHLFLSVCGTIMIKEKEVMHLKDGENLGGAEGQE